METRLTDPEESERFFGEKIISGEYKRCLVVMEDEEGKIHTWNATNLLDFAGLAHVANLRVSQLYFNLEGE